MAILIADSGSTKTNWSFVDKSSKTLNFNGLGINPYINSSEEIRDVLNEISVNLGQDILCDSIFFYGAGCSNDDVILKVSEAFKASKLQFNNLVVKHDLMAAAHALFGNKSGIACILGTGSNSALYDGTSIIDNIPSLGYVIGDEGGGVDIGRRLLIAIFKRSAPKEIRDKFYDRYDLNIKSLLSKIHFEDRPNKFIASFSLFVNENIQHIFCEELVKDAFESFLNLNIRQYKNHSAMTISFVGSIGTSYSRIIKDVLDKKGLTCGEFLADPMQRLIQYHNEQLS